MQFVHLTPSINRKTFNSGNHEINLYFWNMTNQHAKKGISKTHLLIDDGGILGFYTLSSISLDNHQNMIKGYPNRIPAILIGRIGIDLDHQGKGLSKLILSHALHKIKAISQEMGVAFAVIDAKTPQLVDYYQRLGFSLIPETQTLIFPTSKI